MIRVTTTASDAGVQILADAVRAAAVGAGGGFEAAALAARLCADDAVGRCTVNRDSAELGVSVVVDGTELVVTVRDPGEPVTGPPAVVLGLVDSGVVSAATGGADAGVAAFFASGRALASGPACGAVAQPASVKTATINAAGAKEGLVGFEVIGSYPHGMRATV